MKNILTTDHKQFLTLITKSDPLHIDFEDYSDGKVIN